MGELKLTRSDDGGRLRVLVVDDEVRFVESLRLALADDLDVAVATDAGAALAELARDPKRFDVVLCDLAMPGTDGPTFHARMTELGVGDRFVLMTGGAFTPRAQEFVAKNACPTIDKPFMVDHLLRVLDSVTRGRTAS